MITVRDRQEDRTKSFTDETSPKQSQKSDRKVSIHGQVIREESLRWFRDLLKLYPNDPHETKSVRILEDFHTFPEEFRGRTWVEMKKVRIHVVDSLPYQLNYKEILQEVFRLNDIHKLIESDARHGSEFAKFVKKRVDEIVTEGIIRDSTPHRLRELMRPNYPGGTYAFFIRQEYEPPERPVDLQPFRTKRKSMTAVAVKYAGKAAPVFTPAMDRITPAMRIYSNSYGHFEVRKVLGDSHAFDKGDNKSLSWVRNERDRTVASSLYMGYLDDVWPIDPCVPEYVDDTLGELYDMPSHESEYLQAADIAAGFARQKYERYGIAAVAESFEYVTINGERITQDNAEKQFEYWRQLHERQQRLTIMILTN